MADAFYDDEPSIAADNAVYRPTPPIPEAAPHTQHLAPSTPMGALISADGLNAIEPETEDPTSIPAPPLPPGTIPAPTPQPPAAAITAAPAPTPVAVPKASLPATAAPSKPAPPPLPNGAIAVIKPVVMSKPTDARVRIAIKIEGFVKEPFFVLGSGIANRPLTWVESPVEQAQRAIQDQVEEHKNTVSDDLTVISTQSLNDMLANIEGFLQRRGVPCSVRLAANDIVIDPPNSRIQAVAAGAVPVSTAFNPTPQSAYGYAALPEDEFFAG